MARSFKQRGTVVVPLAESPIPMVEVESIDNPAIFSETVAGEGNITGLIVYGKSTQDGTPSPESPVPIVSAGDDGEIGLQITGKNLLDQAKLDLRQYNIYYGSANSDLQFDLIAGINYTLSVPDDVIPPNGIYFRSAVDNSSLAEKYNTRSISFKPDKNTAVKFDVYWAKGRPENATKLQLEVGSTATPYEPYKSQSLTISTPNGLPGIPVDSGGNYTDAEGQQSVCDVKDYGTGKYTQMVGHIESYNGENITTPYMSTTGQLTIGAEVYYVLDEPVVTDISADELTAYRALHTYDGTTVISVNSDPIAPGVKTTVKIIDPNSGNPQIMQLWLDKEGHPVNINGRGARVGGTPTQQYILQPCSF